MRAELPVSSRNWRTRAMISGISCGRVPPLVSQSTSVSAPPATARAKVARQYSRLFLNPSKKCSAS